MSLRDRLSKAKAARAASTQGTEAEEGATFAPFTRSKSSRQLEDDLISVATPRLRTKRSRTVGPTSSPHSVAKSDEMTICGDEEEEQGDVESRVAPGKPCHGCWRMTCLDCSYFLGEKGQVPWAYPDGRGDWRKDCVGVYRLEYRAYMTMAVFQKHLHHHREDFAAKLLAYLSLKFQGVQHVTKEMLQARQGLLEFVFKIAGVPYPLAALARVTSAMDSSLLAQAHILPNSLDDKPLGDGDAFAPVPRMLQHRDMAKDDTKK